MRFLVPILAFSASAVHAFFVAGVDSLHVERTDAIVNFGGVSSHAHFIMGGSNIGPNTKTTADLQKSQCTTFGIVEDKSAYWVPELYFQWKNGSFTNCPGSAVIYYLFPDDPTLVTPFPDDFKMIAGNPLLRSYNSTSVEQKAINFRCLDPDSAGGISDSNGLPTTSCASGLRAQINFPSCWDGKNADSADHKSHVKYLSDGPDKGSCKDPNFPVTVPRIFIELYWSVATFDSVREQAMNPAQPFVFANGDPTGYGYHADFFNGWEDGVLRKIFDKCSCTTANFGNLDCCFNQGVITKNTNPGACRISKTWDEEPLGTIPQLLGNNPVQGPPKATALANNQFPARLEPIYVYSNDQVPVPKGTPVPGSGSSPASAPGSSTPATSTPTTSTPATSTPTTSSTASPSVSPGVVRIAEPQPKSGQSSSVPTSTPTPNSQCSSPKVQRKRRLHNNQ